MKEIRSDMGSGKQMNRLLQGDYSGKTIIALMSMLIAHDNNTQACLMAPTEILAAAIPLPKELLDPLNMDIRLLTAPKKPLVKRSTEAYKMEAYTSVWVHTFGRGSSFPVPRTGSDR